MQFRRSVDGVGDSLAVLASRLKAALDVARGDEERKRVADRFFGELDTRRAQGLLCDEQSHRCAFCETAFIGAHAPPRGEACEVVGMRIAHWVPRSVDPTRTLDWSNLFGSCDATGLGANAHCDVAQGAEPPPAGAPTPAQQDYGAWLTIRSDGELRPREGAPAFVTDVLALLRLNAPSLKDARAQTIRGLQQRLEPSRQGEYRRDRLEATLRSLDATRSSVRYPTAQRLWLERRVAR